MWRRFHNTFLVLPSILWQIHRSDWHMNALRLKNGFRAQGPLDERWRGHDILFNGNYAWDWPGYRPPYVHLIGPATCWTRTTCAARISAGTCATSRSTRR